MTLARFFAMASAVSVFGFGVGVIFAASDSPQEILRISASSQIRLDPGAPDSASELVRDWGQFELQLPKEHFPLRAPNCRGKIRLRFIAITPDDPNREIRLDERWALLQKLQRIEQGEPNEAVIQLNLKHYVTRKASGEVVLSYCNAFADGGQ
jgi:hypothetical protein